MGKADKVIQAHAIAKRIESARTLVFGSNVQNGFFLTFAGKRVMEFDTNAELNKTIDDLNNAINPVVSSIISGIDSRVDSIVNA